MALLPFFWKFGKLAVQTQRTNSLFFFLMAIPAVYFARFNYVNHWMNHFINYFRSTIECTWFCRDIYTIGNNSPRTSGRNTQKIRLIGILNTSGIYSVVRHPLYLGNYLMWIGIVVYTHNISFVIIVSLMYWLYYRKNPMFAERFLKFGQTYLTGHYRFLLFLLKNGLFRKSTHSIFFKKCVEEGIFECLQQWLVLYM